MILGLGGLTLISKCLRITNSKIEELAASLERLPERDVPETIMLIAALGVITLSLNLF
jgi:hypothetical protein